jgi:hypothetical protein
MRDLRARPIEVDHVVYIAQEQADRRLYATDRIVRRLLLTIVLQVLLDTVIESAILTGLTELRPMLQSGSVC